MSGEFSGKTEYMWGVLRPDGAAVVENPTERIAWKIDRSLDIAGFYVDGEVAARESYEAQNVCRIADDMTEALVAQGVAREAALHTPTLFTIVTPAVAS